MITIQWRQSSNSNSPFFEPIFKSHYRGSLAELNDGKSFFNNFIKHLERFLVKVRIVDNIQREKSSTTQLWSSQKNRRRGPLNEKKVDNFEWWKKSIYWPSPPLIFLKPPSPFFNCTVKISKAVFGYWGLKKF